MLLDHDSLILVKFMATMAQVRVQGNLALSGGGRRLRVLPTKLGGDRAQPLRSC